jgi:hypothetical protein
MGAGAAAGGAASAGVGSGALLAGVELILPVDSHKVQRAVDDSVHQQNCATTVYMA